MGQKMMQSSFLVAFFVLGLYIHSHMHASCNRGRYHLIWVLLKLIDGCVEISQGVMGCCILTSTETYQ